LHHETSPFVLTQTLQTQGIVGKTAVLSCTFVPTDLFAAWCFLMGIAVPEDNFAMEGLTRLEGAPNGDFFHDLPQSLQSIAFGPQFNQSIQGVKWPKSLQSLTFGFLFNGTLRGVTLPDSLESLTLGHDFNQDMKGVTLPDNLQSLTFGYLFNQSMEQWKVSDCPTIFKA